jgi:tRNA wybutosine-synthesizing protein 4
MSEKTSVEGTNDDATLSKLSSVNAGYYADPFVGLFVKKPVKRSPLINRGE